jgi:myo-inositol-1(or 4)-monophosphatase
MTTPERRADLERALSAAWSAGEAIMTSFRQVVDVRQKGPDQPVTAADLAANEALAGGLLGAEPDAGWLSEESVDAADRLGRDRVWIVDPLDGTRSFIGGYREFAVSVALVEGGEVALGVVYNPARDDLFWAIRGGGAYRVRHWRGGPFEGQRLSLPPPDPRARGCVLASRTEIRRGELVPFQELWDVRPLGSTAYKLVVVAAGAGHAFVSRGPKSEWDVAAGGLVLEEAGGLVTDVRGDRLRYNRPDPYVHGVVAAHPAVHQELLNTISRLSSPRLRTGGADGGKEPTR